MSKLVKNIVRFILFILVQVFVLNQIPPLHHLINPYIYFLGIVVTFVHRYKLYGKSIYPVTDVVGIN